MSVSEKERAYAALAGQHPESFPTDSEVEALRWLSRAFGDEFGSGKLAVLYEARHVEREGLAAYLPTSRRVAWARTSGREMGRMCRKGLLRVVSGDGATTYGLTDEAREAIA